MFGNNQIIMKMMIPFLKHFDEDGNFIEHLEPEIEDELAIRRSKNKCYLYV